MNHPRTESACCGPFRVRCRPAFALGLALGLGALAGCGSSQPAASSLPANAAASACTGQESWPSAMLPAAAAATVDSTQFVSQQQLQSWDQDLDNLGLRATGSAAHEANVEALEARLVCAGVQQVHLEDVPMTLWTPRSWSLAVAGGPSAGPVTVAGYVPFNGSTPEQGITAPLVYLGSNTTPTAANSAGRIVLFDLPASSDVIAEFLIYAMGIYDLATSGRAAESYNRPYLAIGGMVTELNALQAAGALGAVVIYPGAYSTAYGAYFPYSGYDPTLHLPGLFVDQNVGAQLKALAAGNTAVTLTLPVTVQQVTTHNVIGYIPGASDELTVINSHTDGTNGIEDNGPNAIVGIAQYLARLPRSALPRSFMIMLSAGHFSEGIGIRTFLQSHAGDGLLSRIASITTVEHMGAQDWEPDANGVLQYSGKPEISGIFMPAIQKFADAAYDSYVNAAAGPGVVLKPLNPSGNGTSSAIWPGEGQYFYALHDLPTANYIAGPSYLLNWGVTTVDKTDFDRMRRQMIAFAQMQLDLSRISVTDLSTVSADVVTVGTGAYGVPVP